MAGIVRYIARHSLKQTAIVEGLRRRIIAGEFAVGGKLPTVGEHLFTRAREGICVSPNPPHSCNLGLLIPQQSQQQFFVALQQEALMTPCNSAKDSRFRR